MRRMCHGRRLAVGKPAASRNANRQPQNGSVRMFFIVGLRMRHSTVDTGIFGCPNEHGDRSYQHVRARRWFTVFFIPLIPLGKRNEWVRCRSCGATYSPDVLTRRASQRSPIGSR
jgi:hypothetical protein